MDLNDKEIAFLRSLFGAEDNRKRFLAIVDKMIDELKDIETLPTGQSLEQGLKIRLESIKKLRELVQRIMMATSDVEKRFEHI